MNRVQLVDHIRSWNVENDSNIKFISMLRSRLMEEAIPPEMATLIAGVVQFDLSNVPEDDDTLSDIATEYASFCSRVYVKLTSMGLGNARHFDSFKRLYSPEKITVDH